MSKFELGFVPIWVFRFCQYLVFWVLSHFEYLSFVAIWVFECSHNLGFVTNRVFEFCHNLSFFEFLRIITIRFFLVLLQFKFLSFIPIWVFEFCHNLSFWVLSQFEYFGFVTISVSFVGIWVLSEFEFLSFVKKIFLSQFKF